MNQKPSSGDEVVIARLKDARELYERTNELLGVFGVTMALASVSTERPKFYAVVSGAFILLLWLSRTARLSKRAELLRAIGHKEATVWSVWKQSWPALIGALCLILVAFGFLDKFGFHSVPV